MQDSRRLSTVSRRGYTDHEHLDGVGLIHMNGRVYDPAVGRFLSCDPYIDGVERSQGANGYAYVGNNPLSYIDPSGYSECRDRGLDENRCGEDGKLLENVDVPGSHGIPCIQCGRPVTPAGTPPGHDDRGGAGGRAAGGPKGDLPPCSSTKGASVDFVSQIGAYGSMGARLTLFGLRARGHAEVNLFSYNTPASGQAYWSRGVEGSIQIGRVRVGVAWEQRSFDGGFSFQSEPTNFIVGNLRGSDAGVDYEVSIPQAGAGFTAGVDNPGALLPAADTQLCRP